MTRARASHHGILLVDKRGGCTSHDVVARVRRVFAQRAVGHAGTLDPMATGLLVVLLGEATKLSAYLSSDSKRYVATIAFGSTTDTLDADGSVTEESRSVPSVEAVVRALASMVGPMEQVPPAVSAVKQGGVAAYVRTRRGETVDLDARSVVLESATLHAMNGVTCDVEIACSKGFYVRALARDLATELGTVAHLVKLRRTQSGVFGVDEAVAGAWLDGAAAGDAEIASRVREVLRPMQVARRAMRVLEVGAVEEEALRCGKRVEIGSVDADGVVLVTARDGGAIVCVAEIAGGSVRVVRGFMAADGDSHTESGPDT